MGARTTRRIRKSKASGGAPPSIILDAKDRDGQHRRVKLQARILGEEAYRRHLIRKQQGGESSEGHDPNVPTSRVIEDEFTRLLQGRSTEIILPPFDLAKLSSMREISTELGQSLDAMVTNTVGFGWQLRERPFPDDATRKRFDKEIRLEKQRLTAQLGAVHPIHALTDLLEFVKQDKYACGNGYTELIENQRRQLVGLNHVHGHSVRLTRRDSSPTRILVPQVRMDRNYMVEEVAMYYRFRRFVQVRTRTTRSSSQVRGHLVWFKEAGDPRDMDWRTGEYAKKDEEIPFRYRATSLIHMAEYNPLTPYGVPRWIGTTYAISGNRAAEEVNWTTLRNNDIPSMFVVVENGALTDDSIARLEEWVEHQIAGSANYSKFIILEGETLDEGAPNPLQFRIRIEPLKQLQTQDQMFGKYIEANSDRIPRSFRLPPIFVGRCHSDDTEFLTRRGWKLYSEIADGEEVATRNPATGALEFQAPTARHHYPFDGGFLLHLRNRGIDALVTPNHRMWTRATVAKNRAEKPWTFVAADSLHLVPGGNGGYLELPVSASWEGEELTAFRLPRNDGEASWAPDKPTKNRGRDEARYTARGEREVPGDEFVRFLGYFVSEGSTTETPGPITLSQNAGEVANRMMAALRGLGFSPAVTESRPGQLKIDICHVGLWAWLREHCGTASDNKRLPTFALDLCQRQLELLLDAMVDGDGSLPQLGSDGSFTYSTTSRSLNDQLHILCLKLGIALTSRRVDRSTEGWSDIWCSYGHYADRHLIHPKEQINEVPYSGMVVCFTVPNGLLVTRRNGRVLISGNSDDYTRATADTSRDIADEQVFAPERRRDDHPLNRFVLSRWDARFHRLVHNHPNITDDIELIRMAAISERSGGMTPRRMDRIMGDIFGDDLGPMPQGIDLDRPYSLQFAEAQAGGAAGGGQGGDGTAQRLVDGLMDLRSRIEKELDARFFLENVE